MSILKVILIVVGAGIALFILLLVYTLWPKIRNVSDQAQLKQFIDTPQKLKRPAFIYLSEQGQYRFFENVLTDNEQYKNSMTYNLPAGSVIVIKKFKTYRNDAGSGFTGLFALGEYTTPTGNKVEFEYYWGGLDAPLYQAEAPDLPTALWMDSTDSPVNIGQR